MAVSRFEPKIVIIGAASGFGAQNFVQQWSAELFPTAIRSTTQPTFGNGG